MNFRRAENADIPEIMEIISAAQNYLKKEGKYTSLYIMSIIIAYAGDRYRPLLRRHV